MKRAERERRELALEEHVRQEAEWLALKSLLDRRIPDSERLVRAMKHPLLLSELAAAGTGPTGVTYATDAVRLYARVIAQRTGGDAQTVQQHLGHLIGKNRGSKLGINISKLKVTGRLAADGGTAVDISFSDRDVLAVAGYLISPDQLNLGNLPPNPFGSPRIAELMERMRRFSSLAQLAPSNPYRLNPHGMGMTSHQLRERAEMLAAVIAHEISRAMPDNEAREAALNAMRLNDCLKTYTPYVVRQTGWQDIRVREDEPVSAQSAPAMRKIAVYGVSAGEPGSPTRYRSTSWDRQVSGRLLNFYD